MADRILVWIEKLPEHSGMHYRSGIWDFDIHGDDLQDANKKWAIFRDYVAKGAPEGIAKMAWYEDWDAGDAEEEGYERRITGEALVILEVRTPEEILYGGNSDSDMV